MHYRVNLLEHCVNQLSPCHHHINIIRMFTAMVHKGKDDGSEGELEQEGRTEWRIRSLVADKSTIDIVFKKDNVHLKEEGSR